MLSHAPFAGRGQQDVLRVFLKDGSMHIGSYMTVANQHFLVVETGSPMGTVEGPFAAEAVTSVQVVKTKGEIATERFARSRGERFPGREPATRDDYQYRLGAIAKAIAREDAGGVLSRWGQLKRQFDDLADQIRLAQGKRSWILKAARFGLRSNEDPKLSDLWFSSVASPGELRRPRPHDFDPDPVQRRQRVPVPAHVSGDPRSIPNMLAGLRETGLKARLTRLGDPPWDAGEIVVDMRDLCRGQRALYVLKAERLHDGYMDWEPTWDGNFSAAGMRRKRIVENHDDFWKMVKVLGDGRQPAAGTQSGFSF
jgi:hypothetical protein